MLLTDVLGYLRHWRRKDVYRTGPHPRVYPSYGQLTPRLHRAYNGIWLWCGRDVEIELDPICRLRATGTGDMVRKGNRKVRTGCHTCKYEPSHIYFNPYLPLSA